MLNFLAALILCIASFLASPFKGMAQSGEENPPPLSLSEAFGNPVPTNPPVVPDPPDEVEPVVVGRKKWSDRAAENTRQEQPAPNPAKSVKIEELDPLRQNSPNPKIEMPLKPPSPLLPSTSIEISREP